MIRTNIHPAILKRFGIFLKKARTDIGLTQTDVSEALGLKSFQSISNIERGVCVTPMYLGKYFVKKYHIDVEDLIEYLLELQKINYQIKFGLIKNIEQIKIPEFKTKK